MVRQEVIRKRLNIDIDRKIVYDVLHHNLQDLEDLKKVFAQFL